VGVEEFVVQIFNGIVIGSTYVLLALGVTLIYGLLNIINFAHGEIFMLGAYFAFVCVTMWGLSYWLTAVLVMVMCGILYVILDFVAFKKVRGFELGPLITSIGVSIFLQNLALILFGGDPRQLPTPYADIILDYGLLSFSVQRFLIIPVALVTIIGLYVMIEKTTIGRAIRAVSQDRQVASLMGINATSVIMFTFAIAGVLVAIPSVLVSPLFYIFPLMGVTLTLKAYIIVVMGGFGNMLGTILAGMILGITESMVAGLGASRWIDAVSFGVLVAFLLVRPYGIIGERREENV
jgi:branched-chain amino acid transport system permease protein